MNSKYLLIFICLFCAQSVFSQDVITRRNGENFEATVMEVNRETVKYRKYSNLSGPIYTISKSEIKEIVYENGETEIYWKEGSTEGLAPKLRVDFTTFGSKFYMGKERIDRLRFNELLKANQEAADTYSTGRTYRTIATVVTLPSAFIFGLQLGAMTSDQLESNTGIIVASGIGTVGGVILNAVGLSKIKDALGTYNEDSKMNFEIVSDGEGVGFKIKF